MKKLLPPKLDILARITTIKHLQYLHMSPYFSWNRTEAVQNSPFLISPWDIFFTKILRIIRMFFSKCEIYLYVELRPAVVKMLLWVLSDFLDELLISFWSNFGRLDTPGKVHHYSKFSPFGDTLWLPGFPKSWKQVCNSFKTDTCQWLCFSAVFLYLSIMCYIFVDRLAFLLCDYS